MFGKILGRTKNDATTKEYSDLVIKIAQMNLTDMRAYVKNSISGLEPSEDGLIAIMERLLKQDANNKRYIESDDNDSKLKKAFDLVIAIAEHKKITVKVVEQIQSFIEVYAELIKKYDTDNKQIYASKLKNSLSKAINNITEISKLNKKMKILQGE